MTGPSQFWHKSWPRIEVAQVMSDGLELAILVREYDGTISAIRFTAEQLADSPA